MSSPGLPTKSTMIPMIMNTFHSSGTPMGKLMRIVRWKQIMTMAAVVVTQPPLLSSSTVGAANSTNVPPWAR